MVLYLVNDILAISLECLKKILNRARYYIKSQKKKVVSNFLFGYPSFLVDKETKEKWRKNSEVGKEKEAKIAKAWKRTL